MPRPSIQVFQYLEGLNAFLPHPLYLELAEDLGVTEWNPVVWIGRFFLLDNDFGEHWFDDMDAQEDRAHAARALGLDPYALLILRPEVFQDGRDGPQHTDEERKRFWTDVLRSLRLSVDTVATEARSVNEFNRMRFPEEYRSDLEERVERWRERLASSELA